MHEANKVLLGSTQSSFRVVDNFPGTLEAGVVACLNSSGSTSLASADGASIGVSLGKDLGKNTTNPVVREGTEVPLLVTAAFTPTVGAQVAVSNTTGKAKAYTGSGDRYVNAYYRTALITGVKEDGTSTTDCCLIDFPGGL